MNLRGIGKLYNASQPFIDQNILNGLGDKTAVYYGDDQITYQTLNNRVNQTANLLKETGLKMEERILINCYDSPELVYAFFGAIKMGAVPIPVNTMMQPHDYEYYLNNSRAKGLIVHETLWEKIVHLRSRFIYLKHVIVISESNTEKVPDILNFHRLLDRQPTEFELPLTCYDDPAFWLYSSGTTGDPKGVIHLHHDMEFATNTYAKQVLKMTENDRCLSASKLYFAYGLGGGMYFPFGTSGSTVLVKERSSPEAMFHAIEKYKPTIFFGVPTLFGAMIDYVEQTGKQFDLSSLRCCTSAGEALPPAFSKRWRELYNLEILDGIGSTEALHIYISNNIGDSKAGSSGKVVPGYKAKVVNEQGVPLPPNEIGDLVISGDSIAQGYWNLHEETKHKFIGKWLNTGDKYYEDENGYFWYCGRADDMMKVGGIWVSPIEIENCLLEYEAIFETAVIGVKNENGLVVPKAYIVLKEGYEPSLNLEREIQEFVKTNLARYKYPRIIHFIEQLPKTATGKIQRFKLRDSIQSDEMEYSR